MDIDEDVSRYFSAARIESVPSDLAAPRYDQSNSGFEERRVRYERCKAATAIWNAADTNTGRLRALKNYQAETLPRLFVMDGYRKLTFLRRGFHEGEEEKFTNELSEEIERLLAELPEAKKSKK